MHFEQVRSSLFHTILESHSLPSAAELQSLAKLTESQINDLAFVAQHALLLQPSSSQTPQATWQ